MEPVELVSVDGVALDAVVHRAAAPTVRGSVLLVHGITVDLDEGGGMFVRLADRLAGLSFDVVRFSFRGHGNSGGTERGVTIAGERLDLHAAVELMHERCVGPLSIVAASFGAVSTALSLPWLEEGLHSLVLWNPVFDLRHTFLEPELPWGVDNFGHSRKNLLQSKGFLSVDGEFDLGQVLFDEFGVYNPLGAFLASHVPTLIVHGDQDAAVSYPIAAEAARKRPGTRLHTVVGSDHGFDSREREDEAITVTVDWLVEQSPVVSGT
ncbi:alpha/beta hydrolase [Nocardia sp. BMG51109]|uniref:alpha/beta hydrolase n=1 Tax=Nocardia sp. BMG51109 TaxID=1056816 RepID=UPI000463EF5A|nr:alpha/beta fold hydrolase [Nocardia sp. BMG51109]